MQGQMAAAGQGRSRRLDRRFAAKEGDGGSLQGERRDRHLREVGGCEIRRRPRKCLGRSLHRHQHRAEGRFRQAIRLMVQRSIAHAARRSRGQGEAIGGFPERRGHRRDGRQARRGERPAAGAVDAARGGSDSAPAEPVPAAPGAGRRRVAARGAAEPGDRESQGEPCGGRGQTPRHGHELWKELSGLQGCGGGDRRAARAHRAGERANRRLDRRHRPDRRAPGRGSEGGLGGAKAAHPRFEASARSGRGSIRTT